MKSLLFVFYALAVILGAPALATASLIVFTNDTIVHSFDTNYDGADIVVSNCTLTVDGPHGFSSLQITPGATLTHSSNGGPLLSVQRTNQNEPQTLSGTNPVLLLIAGELDSISVADTNLTTFYTNGLDYLVTQLPNLLLQLQRTPGSTIPNGATVLVTYKVTVPTETGLRLVITGDVIVANGGSINAGGGGYAGGSGPGNGFPPNPPENPYWPATGGGHGGFGWAPPTNGYPGGRTYDFTEHPFSIGSGGGKWLTNFVGGAGGGYISMRINGTLQVDGFISADGNAGSGQGGGGGGAGGGVFLSTGTLLGNGTIRANGGQGGSGPIGYGGGGGGGRIAIIFNTNSFSGLISTYGGGLTNRGGAGTVLLKDSSQAVAQLLLDNAGHPGANSAFDGTALDITTRGGAVVQLSSANVHNLLVQSNSMLVPPSYLGSYGSGSLVVSGDANIEPGAAISADGAGYSYSGPGGGFGSVTNPGTLRGGGGHGGCGGANKLTYGASYGSAIQPGEFGSAGGSFGMLGVNPGGAGGGALGITVADTLLLDGRVSANGLDGATNAGGGAGGSVWIIAGTLAGKGTISATGGSGISLAGGGGGGRIALTCSSNQFTGVLTAVGGGGIARGGAGTIYFKTNGGLSNMLIIDNGGLAGTNTPLSSGNFVPFELVDLSISGAAAAQQAGPLPFLGNVTIGTGTSLTLASGPTNPLLILKDFTIASGASVSATGRGFHQGQGPGAGNSLSGDGAGGGYGGPGGASASGAAGGGTYGSDTEPRDNGSGGGAGSTVSTGGSEGGGAIRLVVGGTLGVDGTLSADGNPGSQNGAGGGSGGSLWITANAFTGNGWVSASGGSAGLDTGGGGGGGRIAIYSPANTYTGVLFTAGGSGASFGQSGSLFESGLAPFLVASQFPEGTVTSFVAQVDVTFNDLINPLTVDSSGFSLFTPTGPVAASNITASVIGPSSVRFKFPVLDTVGDYYVTLSSGITNLLGQTLSEVYTGAFSMTLPLISGTVRDTNDLPVGGVLLQSLGLMQPGSTDTNGHYSIGVFPGWFGRITPSFSNAMFIPGSIAYSNVTTSRSNQDYLLVTTIAPQLSANLSADNLTVAWHGLAGVTYDAAWSTNLIHWQPFYTVYGSNGGLHLSYPLSNGPVGFIRVRASD